MDYEKGKTASVFRNGTQSSTKERRWDRRGLASSKLTDS